MLIQPYQLSPFLRLQLNLQEFLFLVQELVKLTELCLDSLLQIRSVVLGTKTREYEVMSCLRVVLLMASLQKHSFGTLII